MTRRTFLWLTAAGAVAASSTFNAAAAVVDSVVAPRRHVDYLWIAAKETGRFALRRAASAEPILVMAIAARSTYVWVAGPGHELITRPGEPLFVLDGPACDWHMEWHEDSGRRFSATSENDQIETLDAEGNRVAA